MEHARIEALLDEVIRSVEAGEGAPASWPGFRSALLAQIDAEENHLVVGLQRERDARLLRHEHSYLRGRVGELGQAAERGGLQSGVLKDLRDVLRAHARNDDRLLYGSADTELDAGHRDEVAEALARRLDALSKS